jgi:hypothetical protein
MQPPDALFNCDTRLYHGERFRFAQLERWNGGTLTLEGSDYRKAELKLRRAFGEVTVDETIAETNAGSFDFEWKPVFHSFDHIAVMPHLLMKREQIADFFTPLGATVHNEIGDWVCDGPGMRYSLVLKGHRLLNSDEAAVNLTIAFNDDRLSMTT